MQLPQAVAQALRISRPHSGSTADHLVAVLGSMSLLMVLDNCEHLVDAAGALAERIVSHAGAVHVLATSQELLNVPSEALFKLGPLALPGLVSSALLSSAGMRPAAVSVDEIGQFGAVQLFVERARVSDAHFALSPNNAQAVAQICRHLDGLPLAIELAAARVRLLGVHSLLEKLGERFRVLTGGSRTAMRRHQTLRARPWIGAMPCCRAPSSWCCAGWVFLSAAFRSNSRRPWHMTKASTSGRCSTPWADWRTSHS